MRGISPIIAIIIILLITIAIAGAAYAYISIIWGRTTEGLQLVDSSCSAGTATFRVRNIGTKTIQASAVTITRTSPSGGTPSLSGDIAAGATGDITDATCGAGNMCIYRVLAGGQSQEMYAQC